MTINNMDDIKKAELYLARQYEQNNFKGTDSLRGEIIELLNTLSTSHDLIGCYDDFNWVCSSILLWHSILYSKFGVVVSVTVPRAKSGRVTVEKLQVTTGDVTTQSASQPTSSSALNCRKIRSRSIWIKSQSHFGKRPFKGMMDQTYLRFGPSSVPDIAFGFLMPDEEFGNESVRAFLSGDLFNNKLLFPDWLCLKKDKESKVVEGIDVENICISGHARRMENDLLSGAYNDVYAGCHFIDRGKVGSNFNPKSGKGYVDLDFLRGRLYFSFDFCLDMETECAFMPFKIEDKFDNFKVGALQCV